jgi:hypothetical protein
LENYGLLDFLLLWKQEFEAVPKHALSLKNLLFSSSYDETNVGNAC